MIVARKLRVLLNLSTNNASAFKLGGYNIRRSFLTVEEYRKIRWYKPQRVPRYDPRQSGDLGLNFQVQPTETSLYYRNSKQLEDANDIVKKMFTVGFQGEKEARNLKREMTIGLVKRHICDRGSVEVKIAAMTSEIQDLQKYLAENPKNRKARTFLEHLIGKRYKQLRLLRSWDYPRFEWILEKLNLIYKGSPESYRHVSRKDSIRKLTHTYCEDLIRKKLDSYAVKLKQHQRQFYAEKAEKLESIMRDEKEFGLPLTVTKEQVEAARKKAGESLNEE